MSDGVLLPPWVETVGGAKRRIGIELELIAIDVPDAARIVAQHVGGSVREISRYEQVVDADDGLEWRVELDFRWLRERGQGEAAGGPLATALDEAAEMLVRIGAEQLVPVEVVTPPIAMERMDEVARIVRSLRAAGALGTRAGWAYAFGMQFNPEMPGLDAETITRYLKSFLCLFDWIVQRSRLDLTRRLTGYAAAFPAKYVRTVADPAYWPSREKLIDDYLDANPTRNRALDMLPLFYEVDPDRVRAVVDDPLVKARPALHYRLPNCEIDRADWNIDEAWRDWLQVEHLAADPERLQALCERYIYALDRPVETLLSSWASEIEPFLIPLKQP